MRFKNTGFLLLIFGALLAYVYFVEIKGKEKAERIKERESKLLVFEKDSLKTVFLEPAGIKFQKEGAEWRITEPIRSKTENWVINALINTLSDAKKERTVTRSPESLADYGLAPAKYQIIIQHEDQADTVYLGDKTPTGTYVFARVNSDSTVYATQTALLTHAEKDLFDFRDKTVLDFETDDVERVTIKTPKRKIALRKEGEKWYIFKGKGQKLLADNFQVEQILNGIRNAKAKQFVEETPENLSKYGLTRPAYELELQVTDDGGLKKLIIGKATGSAYYARDISRDPVFTVDSSAVHKLNTSEWDLREKRLSDFYSYQIDYIELRLPDTTYVCEKDTANNWQVLEPVRGKAKNWKISSLASSVSGLKMQKIVDENPSSLKKYGLDKPSYQFICKKEGEEVANIKIGKRKGDYYYAVGTLTPAVVLVKKEDIEKFDISLNDILEKSSEEE